MPDVRYVCLSDLHFGAENSLLTGLVDGDVVVDPARASSVLDGFTAALSALIGANHDKSRKPTLILNGDVLELALANDNVALMVFDLFLDRIFPVGGDALFDNTILYQPGNHDHHLWETARERQYANLLKELEPDAPLPVPWHTTALYALEDKRPVHSELLEQLARRKHHRDDVRVRVSYPNLGIRSKDGQTSVVFHHGHNVESIYQLMTVMKDVIFPGRAQPSEVWDIEAENFAWIDFFWSTLGRSGQVGDDVGLIYEMLQSRPAIEKLAGNLAAGIAGRIPRKGMGRMSWLIRPALEKLLKRVATGVALRERTTTTGELSANAEAGLMAYLSGPLLRQLASEASPRNGCLPEQVKFVFGHTHKPFVGTREVPGLANPVRIFNSGGWVVDTLTVEPLHGVNVVLVDESLEVACVRLYNQASEPGGYRVRLDDGIPAEQGPFYQRLSALIRPDDLIWKTVSGAVAGLVTEREQALDRIITNAGRLPADPGPGLEGGRPAPTAGAGEGRAAPVADAASNSVSVS